jgi:hypothetical protein
MSVNTYNDAIDWEPTDARNDLYIQLKRKFTGQPWQEAKQAFEAIKYHVEVYDENHWKDFANKPEIYRCNHVNLFISDSTGFVHHLCDG